MTGRAAARSAAAALFRRAGIESADIDARILVEAACGIVQLDLVRDPDRPIGEEAGRLLAEWLPRRVDREPVSRIVGRRAFWGMTLAVTPDVLDPRPETESLVAAVIDAVGDRRDAALSIVDLGTGSGAILCALLGEFPRATGIGVDWSPAACRVARGNLETCGSWLRASIVCGDWSDALGRAFDIVVANPPYVPSAAIVTLDREVRHYDPRVALDGGDDGLMPYRAIAPGLPSLLKLGGVAAFECGWDQGARLAGLLGDVLDEVAVLPDLSGRDRIVMGRRRGRTSDR